MTSLSPTIVRETAQPHDWSSASFALATAAAAWLLYLAVALVRCVVYGFKHPYMLMERHALTAVVAVTMSGLIYLLLRRQEGDGMQRRLATALLATVIPAALLSVINYNVMYVFAPAFYLRDMGMDMIPSLIGEVLNSSIENYFVFAAWAVLYTAVSHAVQTRDVLRRIAAADAAARSAELRALRFQLDPHFLFNALNTISGQVLSGHAADADRTIGALSSFLRATLATNASEDISLADELQLQMLYLEIEQVRFGDRMSVELRVPDELADAMIPALLLQPLVENSVRHAVALSIKPVRILVSSRAEGDMLVIDVEDDGPGGRALGGHGVGLANIVSRLAIRYDGRAACTYSKSGDGGFRTEITLPLQFGHQRISYAA